MNAMPVVGEIASSSLDAALSPPDEAPIATIGTDSASRGPATLGVAFCGIGDAGWGRGWSLAPTDGVLFTVMKWT